MSKYEDCKKTLSSELDKFDYDYTSNSAFQYMELLDEYLNAQPLHFSKSKVLKRESHIKVEKKEFDINLKKISIIQKIFPRSDGSTEYKIGRILNQMKNEIPNFIYTFESKTPGKTFMLEYVNGVTIRDDMKNISSSRDKYIEKYASIFLQVFMALFTAFAYYGYVHNDLHLDNVMIVTYPEKRWITYNIRPLNKTVRIFTKYLPVIIDYGLSQVEDDTNTIITSGFSTYDLISSYCIPARDFIKFCYASLKSSNEINDVLAFLFETHPILSSLIQNHQKNAVYLEDIYYILPSQKNLPSDHKNLKKVYNISSYDIVTHLLSTLPSKLQNFIEIRDNASIHSILPILIKNNFLTMNEYNKYLVYLYLYKILGKNININNFSLLYPSFKTTLSNRMKNLEVFLSDPLNSLRLKLSVYLSYFDEIHIINHTSTINSYDKILKAMLNSYLTYIKTHRQ